MTLNEDWKILGFTGSREGLSQEQHQVLADLVQFFDVLHHGDCIGADSEMHDIARAAGTWIAAHPPSNPVNRAYCQADFSFPPAPYLERDRDIVSRCHLLAGAPLSGRMRGSGTWFTINEARRLGRPLIIVNRDGSIVNENISR